MQTLEEVVEFLTRHQLMLTTAESCTAGLMTGLLADVEGCGKVLESGYVTYTIGAKHAMLGVSLQTIQAHGLTSEEVAREMAVGALRASAATITLANTGLAEAEGPMDGVVCFACAMGIEGNIKVVSETVKFDGERNAVRRAAARHGLLHLPEYHQRLRKAGA
jgi:PncC family amidohydrolase